MASIASEHQLADILKRCWIAGEYGSQEYLSDDDCERLASQVFIKLKQDNLHAFLGGDEPREHLSAGS